MDGLSPHSGQHGCPQKWCARYRTRKTAAKSNINSQVSLRFELCSLGPAGGASGTSDGKVVLAEVIVAMVVSAAKELMKLEIMVVIAVVGLAHRLVEEIPGPGPKTEDVGRGIYSRPPSRNTCVFLALSLSLAALKSP